MKICSVGTESFHADGWTNMMKLIVAFFGILQTCLKTYLKCILTTEHSKFAGKLTNNNNNTQAGVFVTMIMPTMMMYEKTVLSLVICNGMQ